MNESLSRLKTLFPAIVFANLHGIPCLKIDRADIKKLISILKNDYNYNSLMDIMCSDYPNDEDRFEITYNLLNITDNKRCLVKTRTNQDSDSIEEIFPNAQWYEMEIYDLFGINFGKNSRRILNDESFKGHPLKKDFPLSGYEEFYYNIEDESVSSRPTQLSQEYRLFKTSSILRDIKPIELDKNNNN